MLSLVLQALRVRRAQALAMFVLALLAGLGSAAAPWFLAWGTDSVARANLASAPMTERIVDVNTSIRFDTGPGNPLDTLRGLVTERLPVEGIEIDVGARLSVVVEPVGATPPTDEPGEEPDEESPALAAPLDMLLTARPGMCDQLRIVEGACPDGPGEVLLAVGAADDLAVTVGDMVTLTSPRLREDGVLRVSGVYEVPDPYGPYWAGAELLPALEGDDITPNPALVSEQTLFELGPDGMQLDAHVVLPEWVFTDPDADLRTTLNIATILLGREGITVRTEGDELLERIQADRRLVMLGVAVGVGQLVLLSWVGLFLAVRHTSDERRADIGLLKLRGATTRRVWALTALSGGVPMVAGTVLGAVGGFAAATGLAIGVERDAVGLAVARTTSIDPVDSLWFSLAAAAVTGLGGLVAALVAEWRGIRTPVVDLLRRVPGGHRGWRADVIDLVVVAVAGAGVYQGYVESRGGAQASVLALLAPALLGLAIALLVARAMPAMSARIGMSGLRSGRAGVALAALQFARRQGTQRVFAVLAVAAAVFTTTTVLWQSANSAWHERAVQELGADRVLTVDAPNAEALLAAVRSVDPDGRYAMAVASTAGPRTEDRVVAIDSQRYGTVGRLPEGLPTPADLVALLRPPAGAPPVVGDGPLALDVSAPEIAPAAIAVRIDLSTVDGELREVEYAALAPGRQTVQAPVDGCEPSCRLVSIEVVVPPFVNDPVTVEIHGLSQPGRPILDAQSLGDISRWRTSLVPATLPPILLARDGRLAVTVPPEPTGSTRAVDARVLPLAAPGPLPAVLAGAPPVTRRGDVRISVLGGTDVPFRVAASVPGLPVVGARGLLVDLEYAVRSNDQTTEVADLSVWLTADAPDTLLPALAERGVTVVSEESVGDRTDSLASYGPGLALLFEYFAVAVILLIAAGVAVVGSTVDRPGRVTELVALRGQGLSPRAARTAGFAGAAVTVVAAVVTGVAAALLAEVLVAAGLPVFSDDWRVLPVPPGLTPLTLLVAVVVIVVVIGVAALTGAARLTAAVSRLTGDRSGATPAAQGKRGAEAPE